MRGKTPEDRELLELLDPVAEAAGYEIVRLVGVLNAASLGPTFVRSGDRLGFAGKGVRARVLAGAL